jgi:Xaa-Pro aminopeptidase
MTIKLTTIEINENILRLQKVLVKQNLPAAIITGFDIFLGEYAPLEECHRYYFSGFSGSVAELLVPATGKVLLFVDGRYYQQADLQTSSEFVKVEKVPYGVPLTKALLDKVSEFGFKKLGVETSRFCHALLNQLAPLAEIKNIDLDLKNAINFQSHKSSGVASEIDDKLTGQTASERAKQILKPGEGIYLQALDQISWLTNIRGYQLPYQSTFMARALLTFDKCYLLIPTTAHLNLETFSDFIEVHRMNFNELPEFFKAIPTEKLSNVYFESQNCSVFDYDILKNQFAGKLIERAHGLTPWQSQKNKSEIKSFVESFTKASNAIIESLRTIKKSCAEKKSVSELDFFDLVNANYKKHGAIAQSFRTISGFGANGSIIHYSTPSAECMLKPNELILLDSGGFYESGYATDCTRTILSGGTPTPQQKEIYTLVLKGLLQLQNAVFAPGTSGACLDALARQPMLKFGYIYAHGTGHGVGVNVHEAGYSITPMSQVPMREGQIGSVEPGIYLPGIGGVRLENLVVVEKHPVHQHLLHFRPLNFVGFDHVLINFDLLTSDEKKWLSDYEKECESRGTTI